jgi:hypothetical protein
LATLLETTPSAALLVFSAERALAAIPFRLTSEKSDALLPKPPSQAPCHVVTAIFARTDWGFQP